jgi:hypothetical protein
MLNDGHWSFFSREETSSRHSGSCFHNYRNTEHHVHIRVIYEKNSLEVWIDSQKKGFNFEKCFQIDHANLPTDYYFGVSSQTSELPDNHELISVDVYELNPNVHADPVGHIFVIYICL